MSDIEVLIKQKITELADYLISICDDETKRK